MSIKKIRLYRAISKREKNGIFSLDAKEKLPKLNKACIADEIYSHVISSYEFRKGMLYSFTDDISVAYKYFNKHPEKYIAIGYVDIIIENNSIVLPEKMLYLQRISEFKDWLHISEAKEDGYFENLNYKARPILILNTLIPSQKSVYSCAKNSREYVAICDGLKLNVISDNYIEPEWCKPYRSTIGERNSKFKHYNLFKLGLQNLSVSDSKKKYINKQLEEYQI